MSQTSPGCLHRRRGPHADRQGAARRVPQHPPDDLLVRAIRGALAQAPSLDPGADRGRDRRLRHARGRAGHERGAHRACCWPACRNTVAGVTVNRFCASGLHRGRDGGRPHPRRRGRRDDRRRHRVDEHGADDGQPAVDEPEHLRAQRERRHRLRHGHHRREGRRAVEGVARGPGRVRAGVAPQGDRRPAEGRVQGRDRSPSTWSSAIADLDSGKVAGEDAARRAPTRARAPTPASKRSPSCGRCSPPRAASPPATARRRRDGAGAVLLVVGEGS